VIASVLLLSYCNSNSKHENAVSSLTERAEKELFVDNLLSEMTLSEKIGQMLQVNVSRLMGTSEWDSGLINTDWLEIIFDESFAGSLLSGGGANPPTNNPESWAEFINELQTYAIEHSRLDIPLLYGVDAVHGFNSVQGATIFPHNIGMGATRHPKLIQQLAERTATAVRSTGIHWTFAPVSDLGTDPRWGRFYETFGEDHFLTSEMVIAAIHGYQKDDLSSGDAIAATGKHFAGYGQSETGMDRTDAEISQRNLREVHLEPFRRAIEAGVSTIMPNSGSVNGVPVHASRYLLTDVLRDELGFEGVVISDWNDCHKLIDMYHIAEDLHSAVEIGIEAGIDMFMIPHNALEFHNIILELVGSNRVSIENVDRSVRRVLNLKWDLGLFENVVVDPEVAQKTVIGGDQELARQAARESIVLLRNEADLLPLSPGGRSKILVTGLSADSVANQMGGWTIGWQGVTDSDELPPAVTIIQGIEDVVGSDRVVFVPGVPESHDADQAEIQSLREEAVEKTEQADIAVIVVGEEPYAEFSGDTTKLELRADQQELVAEIADTGIPVLVVVISGRPLVMEKVMDNADAILMAHLPGTEGGNAVADVMFGEYNPSGHLAFSWPKHVGQIPINYNSRLGSNEEPNALDEKRVYDPLFHFGFGMSYTEFAHWGVTLASRCVEADDTVRVWVEASNLGEDYAGEDVIELYVRPKTQIVSRRRRQLVAFQRVRLEPGQTKTVELTFPASRLSVVLGDINGNEELAVQPGEYELLFSQSDNNEEDADEDPIAEFTVVAGSV
jgi:beta-glucosidase